MIDRASSGDPAVLALLAKHPRVKSVQPSDAAGIQFQIGEWSRSVRQLPCASGSDLLGIVELIDNNPLVCADIFNLPSPVGILASIALGPIIAAGLLIEPPVVLSNISDDISAIEKSFQAMGWNDDLILEIQEQDFQGVLAITAIAAIDTPSRLEDIDDLYDERFSRSFFVQRNDSDPWDIALVKGSQQAVYRLRISTDGTQSLLTIQVMADRQGKCGAGALVHAMNVMAGFEESLGLTYVG